MAKGTSPTGKRSGGKSDKSARELAPLGEKNNELTDEQKQALFLSGLGKIERLKAEAASITAQIRNERSVLKAEGFDKARVDKALKLRSQSAEEIAADIQAEKDVFKWLGHGEQLALFGDGQPVQLSPIARAKEQGLTAGKSGDSP